MAERRTKLRRLDKFRRRLPHISQSALSAVLDDVEQHGVPALHSRRDLYAARELQATTMTPYGELHQDVDLTTIAAGPRSTLRIAHPLALLWLAYTTCIAFGDFIDACHAAKPSTQDAPWSLCLYSDEVTPGNPLVVEQKKKVQVVYWSMLEFGADALSREDMWFLICQKRSADVNKIEGGMAQLFGSLIKQFFLVATSTLMLGGMALKRAGKPALRLFAKLACFVQDGGAHKVTWHCKGDAGTKHCLICKNLFTDKSQLVAEDDTELLRCNVIVHAELDRASSAELRFAARRVTAFRSIDDPETFKYRQMALGFTYMPYNILCDDALTNIVAPREQFMFDWMHCVFVGGVWNTVMHQILENLRDAVDADPYTLFHDYLALWHWPGQLKSQRVHEIFASKRRTGNASANIFKCGASEGLSAYAVVAHFIQKVLQPLDICGPALLAYIALTDLIDCLYLANRGHTTRDMMFRAVERFLALFVAAFGIELLSPKFHWLLHFEDNLHRFGTLISCFVHERKHKSVKRYANNHRNTAALEKAIMHECTATHLAVLDDPTSHVFQFSVGLIGPKLAPKKVRDFLQLELDAPPACEMHVSTHSRFSASGISVAKDVVLFRYAEGDLRAGTVWFHANVFDAPISLVTMYPLISINRVQGWAEWSVTDSTMVILTEDILENLIWTRTGDVIRTLVPRQRC